MESGDHDVLIVIRTQNEAILERLKSGDMIFEKFVERFNNQEKRIDAGEHRLADLDGGNGWPSFVDLQKAHLRQRNLFWVLGLIWSAVAGITGWLAAWLGMPLWHRGP